MGHVVFWAMPFPKLRRLMCARLPVLSGEFTVTPTDGNRGRIFRPFCVVVTTRFVLCSVADISTDGQR